MSAYIKWRKGKLIVECQATIRVPIVIEAVTWRAIEELKLSGRERQVLFWLLKDKQNKEIASEICISERTVKFHVSNILAKFGLRGRTALINHIRGGHHARS
jgi:DNA-binding CsgD family transcriptional regulator